MATFVEPKNRIMHFGVITFPGSNCDQDMIYTLETTLGQKVSTLWHKDSELGDIDVVVLPGGFSYGDYLRSGAIARFSPIMQSVIEFANKGGWVIGVCNGFQILCETGLLPGALMHNSSHRFICKNVELKAVSKKNAISAGLTQEQTYTIPIAHGEGKYFVDSDTLEQMEANDQILFRYCNAEGVVDESSNPNGSLDNIAGVSNAGHNVIGMMPHPERAADANLKNEDGVALFRSFIQRASKVG